MPQALQRCKEDLRSCIMKTVKSFYARMFYLFLDVSPSSANTSKKYSARILSTKHYFETSISATLAMSSTTVLNTCLQKYLNTPQREESTEMSCVFRSIFIFFLTARGHPPPPLPPPPHTPVAARLFRRVHKYLNTFSCCCNFLNIAAT